MEQKKCRITGIRLRNEHFEKADAIAAKMRISRNHLIGLLIENAELLSAPELSVELKNNRTDTQSLSGSGINAIAA